MKRIIIQISILTALIFAFAGCGPGGVIVTARPEAPYYARPATPGPDYVWVDGDWEWTGGRYVYRNGYWARPRAHRVWVAGSWEQRGDGWRWRRGHWRR